MKVNLTQQEIKDTNSRQVYTLERKVQQGALKQLRHLLLLLLAIIPPKVGLSQSPFSWDLDSYHNYSTFFHLEFRSNGLASGEDNSSAYIRNISSSTIRLSMKFVIKDFCGNTTTEIWAGGVTLKPGQEAIEGYSTTNKCKETKKDGQNQTGIASVTCQVSNFKNITEEENEIKAANQKKQEDIDEKRAADGKKIAEERRMQTQQTQPAGSYYSSQNSNKNFPAKAPQSTWQETNARIQAENQQRLAEQQRLRDEQQQALQRGSEQMVNDATELVGMIGNMIRTNRAEKEKKEERRRQQEMRDAEDARQKREKAEELARWLANRHELRKVFFAEYTEGGVPLSSSKVDVDVLYYFTYVFDKSLMPTLTPAISLSNIFTIGRYADGTWPFKDAIVTDIKKLGASGDITLIGYFTTKELAQEMRDRFLTMAQPSGLDVKDIFYKGKQSGAATAGGGDFWGGDTKTGTKTTGTKTNTDADFWGANTKPAEAGKATIAVPRSNGTISRRETKKELDDYWGTDKKETQTTKPAAAKTDDDFWGLNPGKGDKVVDSVIIKNKPKPATKKKSTVKKPVK